MTINVSPIDKLSFVNLIPVSSVHSESANTHSCKTLRKLKNFVIDCSVWFVTRILGKRVTKFS